MTTNWNPRRLGNTIIGLLAMVAIAVPAAMAAAAAPATADADRQRAAAQSSKLWQQVASKPSEIRTAGAHMAGVRPTRSRPTRSTMTA